MRKISVLISRILIVGVIILSMSAEAHSCDSLVGSYAVHKGEVARIWIEHQGQGYVLSTYNPEQKIWTAYQRLLAPLTHDQLSQIPVQTDAQSCGLAGEGIFFAKTFVAAKFSGMQTSQNFAAPVLTSKTGIVLVSLDGFASGGMDLFRVEKATMPPAPTETQPEQTGYCPDDRPADMSQSTFNALPPEIKRQRRERSPQDFQRDVMCGQYLNGLMSGTENPTPASDAVTRAAVLQNVRVLLAASSVPRTSEGKLAWWAASGYLLAGNESPMFSDQPPPTMQQDYYALFAQEILPRLASNRPDPTDYEHILFLAQHAVNLPEESALRTLDLIKSMQALGDLEKFHKDLAVEVLGKVRVGALPISVFNWFVRGKPMIDAIDASSTLDHVIARDDVIGVNRLLAAGVSPLNRWAAPDIFEQSAAAKAYKSTLVEYVKSGKGKLLADVADDLLRRALDNCGANGNEDVSLALSLGASPTRFFLHPNTPQNVIAARLLYCPAVFTPLLKAGLQLNLRYPLSTGRDAEMDTPLSGYLRMRDPYGRILTSAEAVRLMLTNYNNVNAQVVSRNGFSSSLLNYGIDTGNVDIVKTMLHFGVDPQAKDSNGFPAWLRVLDGDKADILTQIIQVKPDIDLNTSPDKRVSPLGYAECLDAPRVALILRQHGAQETGTAFCRRANKANVIAPQ